MKPNRVLVVAFLCALSLVLLPAIAPTAAVAASSGERAQFGIQAQGPCLVDLQKKETYPEREYVLEADGFLACYGQGLIAGQTEFKMVPVYQLAPSTLRVGGRVAAAWTYDGVRYELRARLYATAETAAFVGIAPDFLNVGHDLPGVGDWVTLRYSGTWTVGAERTPVEGGCCVGASSNPQGIPGMSLHFIIPGYEPFGLTWVKQACLVWPWGLQDASGYLCPAADRLDYWASTW